MKQHKNIFIHIISYIWNAWLKPPKLFQPKTILDIQKEASKIGGQQFPVTPGLEQVFFWMPENRKSLKLGEYVYMRYQPDKAGNIDKVISHIHYPLTKTESGSVEIKKYFASDDISGETNYAHQEVDKSELKDLLTAAKQLKINLAKEWGYPLKN